MKKNFYWFACFACATVALAFSSCNDDKIEPDIEVPTGSDRGLYSEWR